MGMLLKSSALLTGTLALAGCSQTGNAPLLFGQTHTVGIGIHGSAAQQGADLTVGYKDFNIAIVPVTATTPSGQLLPILADVRGTGTDGGRDALSVFGHFGATAEAGTTQKVVLGKFFATGLAAQRIATGFATQLAQAKPNNQ
jgi:hypothetical protein